MSFESDVSVAVSRMFQHTKRIITKNLIKSVKDGNITIDINKVPGLTKIIEQSIDEGFRSSGQELNKVLANKK